MSTNHRRRWRALCVAALVLPLAAATSAAAAPTTMSTSLSTTTSSAGASTVAARPGRHPSRVQLPTGERIAVRWAGDTPLVGRMPGDRSPLTVVRAAGRVYAVPVEARPFLGGALDLSLFDVAALADRTGPAPVTLTYAGPVRDVPGVRITSRSGSHAAGTVASAADLGAALRAAVRRGPAAARAAGTPVAGLTGVALDVPAARTVTPKYPMRTLTVKLVPPPGTLLGAAVLVTNTDDTRTFSRYVPVGPDDVVKLSVPDGHYMLVGDTAVSDANGRFQAAYQPIVADYPVTASGQTVTVDATKATATAGFTTPEPCTLASVGADVATTDGVHETPPGIGWAYEKEDQLHVQPVARPKHGVLELDAYEHRTVPTHDGTAEDWHLTAEWRDGVPADLRRTPAPAEFATVVDTVPADGSTGGVAYGNGPVYPDLRGGQETLDRVDATRHVDHLYGPADVRWVPVVYRKSDGMTTEPVRYEPGRTYRVGWFTPSLGAGFAGGTPFPRPYGVACRTAGQLALSPSTELDADPAHSGWVDPGDTTGYSAVTVSADGRTLADVADSDTVTVPVDAAAHTYRIGQTVRRDKLGATSATTVDSQYTVPSSATSGAALPAGWTCPAGATGATLLPLLTMAAPVPALVPVGRTEFVVTVGHLPGGTAAVTGLTAATSVAGGAYRPAQVTALGGGRYRVAVDSPADAAGKQVGLRLAATDAAGSTLTRTVTAAYAVQAG